MTDVENLDEDTHKNDDLEERAARFGEEVIAFAREAGADHVTRPILSQLVESATRVGAKFAAASAASGRPDFVPRIAACREAAETTKYWLRMVTTALPDQSERGRVLWKEVHELGLVFETLERHHQRRSGRTT